MASKAKVLALLHDFSPESVCFNYLPRILDRIDWSMTLRSACRDAQLSDFAFLRSFRASASRQSASIWSRSCRRCSSAATNLRFERASETANSSLFAAAEIGMITVSRLFTCSRRTPHRGQIIRLGIRASKPKPHERQRFCPTTDSVTISCPLSRTTYTFKRGKYPLQP